MPELPDHSPRRSIEQIADAKGALTLADINSGNPEQLIEYCWMPFEESTEYIKVFLLSYRGFTNPTEVLELIRKKFSELSTLEDDDSKSKKLRIINFVKKWIELHSHDFVGADEKRELLSVINRMAEVDPIAKTLVAKDLSCSLLPNVLTCFDAHSVVYAKVRNIAASSYQTPVFAEPPPKPIAPKDISDIYDIDLRELARQMTLIEAHYFGLIEPKELIGLAWTKKNKAELCPNLLRYIGHTNTVIHFIVSQFVREAKQSRRVKLMEHFLQLALEFKELANLNGIFQVLGALGSSSVNRMKKTFAALPTKSEKALQSLRELTDAESSWKNYRQTLHTINPPCIPFIGVYQSDLTFVEDGNKSLTPDGLVNFSKSKRYAEVIQELQVYQQTPYNLAVVLKIKDWFTEQCSKSITDDAKLWEMSLEVEPRDKK